MDTVERLSTHTAVKISEIQADNLMKFVSCLAEADGMYGDARFRFGLRYPRATYADLITKAAIAAGTTTTAGWASELAALKPLTDGFLEYVRPQTLLGKIAFRRVPFNISVASQTGGGTYAWAGQGAPKPVTKPAYASVTLAIAKAVGIIITTDELVKLSRPGAEVALRDEMSAGSAQFLDVQLVDPSVAAVANVSPGSITNGVTPIASAGTSAANALTDNKALIAAFFTGNPNSANAVIMMSPANSVGLAIAANASTLGMNGGTLWGIPVYTSTALGTNIVMADTSQILVADDGGIDISVSRNATVQMDSAPDATATASTVYVSLFQAGLVGLRVDRWINWKRGKLSAVQYVSGASYV